MSNNIMNHFSFLFAIVLFYIIGEGYCDDNETKTLSPSSEATIYESSTTPTKIQTSFINHTEIFNSSIINPLAKENVYIITLNDVKITIFYGQTFDKIFENDRHLLPMIVLNLLICILCASVCLFCSIMAHLDTMQAEMVYSQNYNIPSKLPLMVVKSQSVVISPSGTRLTPNKCDSKQFDHKPKSKPNKSELFKN